jgi:hypothetical protein
MTQILIGTITVIKQLVPVIALICMPFPVLGNNSNIMCLVALVMNLGWWRCLGASNS